MITDASVATGSHVKPYSVITESHGRRARPDRPVQSHCRPGSRLDEDVHLGNFVETKKTHMMAGAKANHLAYLGDASVGAKANIGAGVITCNYDGVGKSQTMIEANAFVGSDSQLVAPVTVGRDAYVGAGSTVTKDVPRGALAISRMASRSTWRAGPTSSARPSPGARSHLKAADSRARSIGEVYCSIDKIDLAARVDGKPIAVQTDHRTRDEIAAEPELSVLFALARVINARAQLADDGHLDAAVHYIVADEPPPLLREALAAAGGMLDRGRGDPLVISGGLGAAAGSETAVGALADRSFTQLAHRAAARVGVRDLAVALHMLEHQTYASPPARDDEVGYWTRVLELSALAGELLRAKYRGHWIQSDRSLVPFGFQLAGAAEHTTMFPTNRAQRVVEDGHDESLFKLLTAAEETLEQPLAAGRLMPSLRDRRDVVLDEIAWRPILSDDAPEDLPIVVCGIDGESTFGVLRSDALPKPPDDALAEAYANLAAETVRCDELVLDDARIIVVSGSFYAAEKVLDRAFMRSLHATLGADLLAASVPARGCLLVGTITDQPASIGRFAELARTRHAESGGRAISPAVLLISNGRVAGYVRGPGDHDEHEPRPGLLRRLFGRK